MLQKKWECTHILSGMNHLHSLSAPLFHESTRRIRRLLGSYLGRTAAPHFRFPCLSIRNVVLQTTTSTFAPTFLSIHTLIQNSVQPQKTENKLASKTPILIWIEFSHEATRKTIVMKVTDILHNEGRYLTVSLRFPFIQDEKLIKE